MARRGGGRAGTACCFILWTMQAVAFLLIPPYHMLVLPTAPTLAVAHIKSSVCGMLVSMLCVLAPARRNMAACRGVVRLTCPLPSPGAGSLNSCWLLSSSSTVRAMGSGLLWSRGRCLMPATRVPMATS